MVNLAPIGDQNLGLNLLTFFDMNVLEKLDEVAKRIAGTPYGKKGTREYNHWYQKYRISREAFIEGVRYAKPELFSSFKAKAI